MCSDKAGQAMNTILALFSATCAIAAMVAANHGTPAGVVAGVLLSLALGITAILVSPTSNNTRHAS